MGVVKAVCISKKRGIKKANVKKAHFIPDWGIENDAHGGNWHRQISILSADRIDDFNEKGAGVDFGSFGENLVVSGIDFSALNVGTYLRCKSVLLEITQIGKDCHSHCAIYKKMGDCIMPREGVFARVLEEGDICVGDEMTIEETKRVRPWQAAIITLSDKGAKGERVDESGPAIHKRLVDNGYEVVEDILIPDDAKLLKENLVRLADQRQLDLILTTGGTGFGPRDITPEATLEIADKNVPGIAEAIRAKSLLITDRAMLSRAVSVIRKKTLIINLPGSPKACMETMDVFMDVIPHGMELLRDIVSDCAR